jgi:hypothetical protein
VVHGQMAACTITLKVSVNSKSIGKGRLIRSVDYSPFNFPCTGSAVKQLLLKADFTRKYLQEHYVPFFYCEAELSHRSAGTSWRVLQDDSAFAHKPLVMKSGVDDAEPININLIHQKNVERVHRATRAVPPPQSVSSASPNAAYFGCGVVGSETVQNCSTLIESSDRFGAAFLFSILAKANSTKKSWKSKVHHDLPMFRYRSLEDFSECCPYNCPWVAVTAGGGGKDLATFSHPSRAIYMFFEDETNPPIDYISRCTFHVSIPSAPGDISCKYALCQNLVGMVLYDRFSKRRRIEMWKAARRNSTEMKKRNLEDGDLQKDNLMKRQKKTSHTKARLRCKGFDSGNMSKTGRTLCRKPAETKKDDFSQLESSGHFNSNTPKLLLRYGKYFYSRLVDYLYNNYRLRVTHCTNTFMLCEDEGQGDTLSTLENFCRTSSPARRAIESYYVVSTIMYTLKQVCDWLVESSKDGVTLRLQAYPVGLSKEILKILPENLKLCPREFTHVAYVTYGILDGEKFLAGVAPRAVNFGTSSACRTANNIYKTPGVFRGYFKLWEVEMRRLANLKECRCLDLGSNCRGGWTEYLSRNAKDVVLVSKMKPPAEFYTNKNLTFIESYARGGYEDVKKKHEGGFDVLLADINCDSKTAVSTIGIYSDLLKDGGTLIMTIKLLHSRTDDLQSGYSNMLAAYGFANVRLVWLFTNAKQERLLVATKKG